MTDIAVFLSGLPIKSVELLACHSLGEGKRRALGLNTEKFTSPSASEMHKLLQMFISKGVPAIYNS